MQVKLFNIDFQTCKTIDKSQAHTSLQKLAGPSPAKPSFGMTTTKINQIPTSKYNLNHGNY